LRSALFLIAASFDAWASHVAPSALAVLSCSARSPLPTPCMPPSQRAFEPTASAAAAYAEALLARPEMQEWGEGAAR
jgi:hypothetical protein